MILHFFLSSLSTAGLHRAAVRESSAANSCLAAAAAAAAAGHRVFTRPTHDAPGRRAQLTSRWIDRQKKKKTLSALHLLLIILIKSSSTPLTSIQTSVSTSRAAAAHKQAATAGTTPHPPTSSGPIAFSHRAGAHTCCRQDVPNQKPFICWLCFHDDLFGPFEFLPTLKVVAKLGSSF